MPVVVVETCADVDDDEDDEVDGDVDDDVDDDVGIDEVPEVEEEESGGGVPGEPVELEMQLLFSRI